MPRPKKPTPIYEKTHKPFRTDMDLVIGAQKGDESCYVELWDKYFLLRQKEKFSFINWCKNHKISNNIYQDYVESWESDAWEKFRNQMAGVRINDLKTKGYTPENWGITIRLKGYFEVVNRSYSNTIIKKLTNETSNVINYNNGDKESENVSVFDNIACNENNDNDILKNYAKKLFKKSYSKMLSDLNMKQHKVISMKEENESISSITKTLGIKRKEANEILSFAKDRLEYWVEQTSKNDGIPMTYNDMIEYFTSK